MKPSRVFLSSLLILASTVAFAEEAGKPLADPALERFVRGATPLCSEMAAFKEFPFDRPMPAGMKARGVKVESPVPACATELLVITTAKGNYYAGRPWFLDKYDGPVEQKLTRFSWDALHETVKPVVLETRNREGLRRVDLRQTTEWGSVPMRGVIDEAGTMFFLGDFHSMKGDSRGEQFADLERLIASAPSRGSATAKVSVVELSDFQCPSCRRSAGFMKTILAKYGEQIRYTRLDLPLMSSHPWAFPAALAGQAIHRQSPEAFWKYKETIYENQDKLTAFTISEVARGFAEDNGLDLKRYDADVEAPEVRQQILDGVGAAFSLQIYGTPSFLIDGALVEAGAEGEGIDRYIAKRLAE